MLKRRVFISSLPFAFMYAQQSATKELLDYMNNLEKTSLYFSIGQESIGRVKKDGYIKIEIKEMPQQYRTISKQYADSFNEGKADSKEFELNQNELEKFIKFGEDDFGQNDADSYSNYDPQTGIFKLRAMGKSINQEHKNRYENIIRNYILKKESK